MRWIRSVFAALRAGRKVVVPPNLSHPAYAGFVKEDLAEDHGQAADWTLSLSDESRVHVHEMPDGTFIAHRDAVDPNLGPLHAICHVLTETKVGFVAVAALLALSMRAGSRKGRLY